MTELISIIIPVFNHASVIKKSLETIFNQTYRPFEIIIVNDGSTDNFRELEKEIVNQCQSFQVNIKIIHQVNKGAAAARNRGFKESKGEYVIFWDADTIARPFMLATMYQALQEHREASYAYSQFKFGWKLMKSQEFNPEDLKRNNFIDTTSLIRRDDFTGFDEKLKRFQDWDLWLSLLEAGKKGVFVPKILYKKEVMTRVGMISKWLPRIAYQIPWAGKKVKDYKIAQRIVLEKHHLPVE